MTHPGVSIHAVDRMIRAIQGRILLFLRSFEWPGHVVCANLGLQMDVMQRGRVMMPPAVCYGMIITASIML